MAHVTDHAKQRTKERLGLSKRLAEKNAEKALREGIRHKDTTGGLHRYVESLYWKHQTANNIRIYCNYVYIFSYSLLITVFALPQKYRKTTEKLRKRLKMKERKKIIAVDFDGTLFEQMEEKDWPTPGAPRQAVINYVLEQQRQGARLILWTNRTGRPLGIAVQKCHEYGIEFDAINANLPEMIEKYDNDCRKIFADEYIDDRAIPMPGDALREKFGREFYYIRECLGRTELLAQLAEESAELAQAALKFRRVLTGENPTPTTATDAIEHLTEEMADVELCISLLCGDYEEKQKEEIKARKTARWVGRLEEVRDDG